LRQQKGLFAHTILEKPLRNEKIALPLHRQKEQRPGDKDNKTQLTKKESRSEKDNTKRKLRVKKRKGKKMKKMILMVVAMLSMTMTSYAENENAENTLNVEAYDMSVNIRKLAVTLDMTFDQMESVEEIHRIFCAEMVLAAHANKDEREALVDKAVKKDLRYMRYILDQKQYKKYLLLLNTTLQNRGLK
jgi:hypothetical protein